ncbi:failed axon connections homolog [Saccoglossus kowalevskii]|uniref:Failed axon connections homolog n=1 Tax=Saccoglossus kowalevskii TaxID=10224 RepID=A0ABM0GK17_SACKO|nr:PREDICTED: failed axon connections homolog [Saccoglossus kowalevskii]
MSHLNVTLCSLAFCNRRWVDTMISVLSENCWAIAGGVATTALAVLVVNRILRKPKIVYPRDIVILHLTGRSRFAPSLSPFPLKLETYLRFAKIPYKSVFSMKMSPKGKTPWIEYNGEILSDSSFIIEFLNKEFKVDLNTHLSPSDRAVARAFQKMTEENLYWTLVYSRWVADNQQRLKPFLKNSFVISILMKMIRRSVKKSLYAQGIGRHTEDEIYSIADKDLRALSTFLGDKAFMFGDQPCEEDCAIFGMLAQLVWCLPDSVQEDLSKGDCKNLQEYCYRMKERFWPDWEQCITGEDRGFCGYPPNDPTLFKRIEK